jgi:hypothetical protein
LSELLLLLALLDPSTLCGLAGARYKNLSALSAASLYPFPIPAYLDTHLSGSPLLPAATTNSFLHDRYLILASLADGRMSIKQFSL